MMLFSMVRGLRFRETNSSNVLTIFFYVFILNLIFINASIVYEPQICTKNKTIDCSDQLIIANVTRNSCVIHPTRICQTLKLPSEPGLTQIASEEDSPFVLSLQPYLSPTSFGVPSVSFNISLEIRNPDVKEAYFFLLQKLQESSVGYNSCRVFDISKAKEINPTITPTLYYDCYYGLEKYSTYFYYVIVRAEPMNRQILYQVFVPNSSQIGAKNVCDWGPLILINRAGLNKKTVEMKFSSAKPEFEVEYFLAELVNDNDEHWQQNVSAVLKEGQKMHYVKFEVPAGRYNVVITLVSKLSEKPCVILDVMDVNVTSPEEEPNHSLRYAVILVSVIGGVICAGVLYFKFCTNTSKNVPQDFPKVLILYSYDCAAHMEVVLKFAEFLKASCKVDVILDEWDLGNQDPSIWTPLIVQDAQFFLIVISQGVQHKVDSGNKPEMREGLTWGDRFSPTYHRVMGYLDTNNDVSNRILKVVFESYAHPRYIPKVLTQIGHRFTLMSNLNDLLCQLHNQTSKYFPVNIKPKMPGCDYMSTAEGRALQESLNRMKTYRKENPTWFNECIGHHPEEVSEQLGIPSNASSRAVSPARSPGNIALVKQSSEESRQEKCELLPKV